MVRVYVGFVCQFYFSCVVPQVFYLTAVTIRTQRYSTVVATTAQLKDQSNCHHLHHFIYTSSVMPAKRYITKFIL